MKIHIKQDPSVDETEITVLCRTLNRELQELISYIGLADNTIVGMTGEETFFIPLTDILYFESVDRKVFFYTSDGEFETRTTLAQLEEKLALTPFARISKSSIVNLRKVRSIKREENSRLLATLANGERIMVSRQYIREIQRKLGID